LLRFARIVARYQIMVGGGIGTSLGIARCCLSRSRLRSSISTNRRSWRSIYDGNIGQWTGRTITTVGDRGSPSNSIQVFCVFRVFCGSIFFLIARTSDAPFGRPWIIRRDFVRHAGRRSLHRTQAQLCSQA
jgi:hypothetical protein